MQLCWTEKFETLKLRYVKEWPFCVELRGTELNIIQIYKLTHFQYGACPHVGLCQLIAHMFHSIYNIKNRSEDEKSRKVKRMSSWEFIVFGI